MKSLKIVKKPGANRLLSKLGQYYCYYSYSYDYYYY